jgi:glycerol-3-phosphate dehydrogenase (NAD(P)+)
MTQEKKMKITVAGCGRWGSLITWYLDSLGHSLTLYGRSTSPHMQRFIAERRNDLLELDERIELSTSYECFHDADVIIISIASQALGGFMEELRPLELKNKIFVLCMKGIEIGSGKRLSEIVKETSDPSNEVAVWLGPGHVQEFYAGIPNCMVIDCADRVVKERLVDEFSSGLIRFYYGVDMVGNEIGAAAKNVIGIAAGMLDGLGLSTLKGALMSRGTR